MSHIHSTRSTLLISCVREDLRRRFVKAEMTLFKVRYEADTDLDERQLFLKTRDFNWILVGSMFYVRGLRTERPSGGQRGEEEAPEGADDILSRL